MPSQPLAFGELGLGALLLTAAVTGDSLGRILSGQHHKGDPPANPIPHSGGDSGSGSGKNSTPNAQSRPIQSGTGAVNPLAHAHVTPERIDQGVDYAGTGYYTAPLAGRVISAGPGWEGGNEVLLELVDGTLVYFEEGVRPLVKAGQQVRAGDPVAALIPGFHSGTELGYAAKGGGSISPGYSTYAQQRGGGYREGQLTAAGAAFSRWLRSLGAPAGLAEGRPTVGRFP